MSSEFHYDKYLYTKNDSERAHISKDILYFYISNTVGYIYIFKISLCLFKNNYIYYIYIYNFEKLKVSLSNQKNREFALLYIRC